MSEIKVDTLTGKTSAGDITVTSEGGAATMQLQQGLAKSFLHYDQLGTNIVRDSLNTSSVSDDGTGIATNNISNSMNNTTFCVLQGACAGTYYGTTLTPNGATGDGIYNTTTSSFVTGTRGNTSNSFYDCEAVITALIGDLA